MKLRFFLFLNEDEYNKREVFPNYKDDLAKETELENNQRFYRDKLSGKFSFLSKPSNDFDFITSQVFDTQFNMIIEKSFDFGQTWSREYIGKFFKTDCVINFDDKKIEVQPDAVDDYTEVLAGLEKELNLSDQPIEIQRIFLQKRPLIQIYVPGDEIVSCFLSGMTWEQDVREATTNTTLLTNTYHFAFSSVIRSLMLNIDGIHADATGVYTTKTSNANNYTGNITGTNGYRLNIYSVYDPDNQNYETFIDVILISTSQVILTGSVYAENGLSNNENIIFYDSNFNAQGSGTFTTTPIYARYLLDVPTINGVNTYPIVGGDLVEDNRNYRRTIGYAVDVVYTSTRLSDEPTEWGKNSAGKYFLPPYSIFGQQFFPIARSRWDSASFWFAFDFSDPILEVQGRSPVTLKDSYPIHSVISVLLKEFAPDIVHEGTPEYSEFLYGETNPITDRKFRVFMSQKTNLLNIQYQNPAQKTPMTLQRVLNMLRDCFRCFWYIEDKKLKIEHVKFFMNGGSYDAIPEVGYDATKMINVRNGKDWAFDTSTISYDKIDMPERFQFKWMDDVSKSFEGDPIEVISRYVMPGKIEEVNISNFNSDIDYLLLNPSEISNDGFALMAAVDSDVFKPVIYGGFYFIANNSYSQKFFIKPEYRGMNAKITLYAQLNSGSGLSYVVFFNSAGTALPNNYFFVPDGLKEIDVLVPNDAVSIGVFSAANISGEFRKFTIVGEYELPFVYYTLNGNETIMQNGLVAFRYIQPNFYIYDMPASQVRINGIQTFAYTDKKAKQDINFPINSEINPMQLIRTHIGLGQIDKISLNLHSRMSKTTLKYDTEQ